MKKLAYLLIGIIFSSLALASDITRNEHTGPYAELLGGVNVGTVFIFGVAEGVGWSGAVGYQFTPGFGLEAGLMQNYLSDEVFTVPIVSTRFIFQLTDCFNFITKLGVMAPMSEQQTMGLIYTGVGLTYAVTKKVDLGIQYQGAIFGVANAGLVGIGFTYHF